MAVKDSSELDSILEDLSNDVKDIDDRGDVNLAGEEKNYVLSSVGKTEEQNLTFDAKKDLPHSAFGVLNENWRDNYQATGIKVRAGSELRESTEGVWSPTTTGYNLDEMIPEKGSEIKGPLVPLTSYIPKSKNQELNFASIVSGELQPDTVESGDVIQNVEDPTKEVVVKEKDADGKIKVTDETGVEKVVDPKSYQAKTSSISVEFDSGNEVFVITDDKIKTYTPNEDEVKKILSEHGVNQGLLDAAVGDAKNGIKFVASFEKKEDLSLYSKPELVQLIKAKFGKDITLNQLIDTAILFAGKENFTSYEQDKIIALLEDSGVKVISSIDKNNYSDEVMNLIKDCSENKLIKIETLLNSFEIPIQVNNEWWNKNRSSIVNAINVVIKE